MPLHPAEFEERSFEAYFNQEMRVIETNFWVPGQVLEGKLGFDVAAFTDDIHLRSLFQWRELKGILLNEPEFEIVTDRLLPRFRCNFFIQHKRPGYYSAGNKTKKWKSWGKKFF